MANTITPYGSSSANAASAGWPLVRVSTSAIRCNSPSSGTLPKNAPIACGALEPHRLGRHRQQGVGGQELHKRVDVDGLPGGLEALHQSPLRCRRVLARQPAFATLAAQPVTRALERAVDGCHRVAERLGRLRRRPTEHVAQEQDDALARRQELEGGDEGEADALAQLRLRRRAFQQRVRIRLQVAPDLLVLGATRPLLEHPQADVGRDPVQPRRERRPRLKPIDCPPRAQHRLLHRRRRRRRAIRASGSSARAAPADVGPSARTNVGSSVIAGPAMDLRSRSTANGGRCRGRRRARGSGCRRRRERSGGAAPVRRGPSPPA